MKIRIMSIVSIFLLVMLLGCVKIYTSPPESETTVVPQTVQGSQDNIQQNPAQQEPVSSGNTKEAAPEPEPEPEVPLPDLVPTEILYDTAKLKIGTTIFFDSGIFNGGDAPSNGFNIKWFVNGSELGYGGHQGIKAGSLDMTYNSQFYWKPVASGNYTIEFVVDCDEFIPESDEDNNTVSVNVTIP